MRMSAPHHIWLPALALLLITPHSVMGQEGPFVPCSGCEALSFTPLPESGSWYNPDQPGSGVNLEIQNGYLLGYFYTYDDEGTPTWRLFSGAVVRSELADVHWEVVAPLQHFVGGNCAECDYAAPALIEEAPLVRLEFLQRSYLRLTVGDASGQFFVPLIYGSSGHKWFGEVTPFVFPDYGGYFMLIAKPPNEPNPFYWESQLIGIDTPSISPGDWVSRIVSYRGGAVQDEAWSTFLQCSLGGSTSLCGLHWNGKDYQVPIAQLTDTRFSGEAEDGWTIEGFRVDYD